jgi:hypothetical protein
MKPLIALTVYTCLTFFGIPSVVHAATPNLCKWIVGAFAAKNAKGERPIIFNSEKQAVELKGDVSGYIDNISLPAELDRRVGFMVGGTNSTGAIRGLPMLNGQPISVLEGLLKPGQGGAKSDVGFLGPQDSLIETLARDNDLVLAAGLTHQQVAEPMLKLISAHSFMSEQLYSKKSEKTYASITDQIRTTRSQGLGTEIALKSIPGRQIKVHMSNGQIFEMNGKSYWFYEIHWMGLQDNPLARASDPKSKSTPADFFVIDLATGKSLQFSGLVPYLIRDWGFYEGAGTPYRVAPEEIIEFFDLKS